LDTIRFSRPQFEIQLGYFEGISDWFRRQLKDRKPLKDAGFGVVPAGGIEPSTHGFSVRPGQSIIYCNRLIYMHLVSSLTLGFVG
jgi:hypothetical protein